MSEIPGPPPYPRPDEGAGKFDSDPWWSRGDDAFKESLVGTMAETAEVVGYTDAARHLRHYLAATGEDLEVDVDRIMREVQSFRGAVARATANLVASVAKRAAKNDDYGESLQFRDDSWRSHYLSQDEDANWFFALGGIRFAITGVVTVQRPGKQASRPEVALRYRAHLWDYYNWDSGKSTTIGPVTIEDEWMAGLHTAGFAREYEVVGTSELLSEANLLPIVLK